MTLTLLSRVVADLTLGKPALPWLSSSACVRDALAALPLFGDDAPEISVWDCSSDMTSASSHHNCLCIGKVCMQQIICYLSSQKCLPDFEQALDAPLKDLLERYSAPCTVQHIDPDASLLEALELIIGGANNLVVPITCRKSSVGGRHVKAGMSWKTRTCGLTAKSCLPKDHKGQEYCWLTQEDVLRFLLGSINVFSPLPMMNIEALGLIRSDVWMVSVEHDASSALESIIEACNDESVVAIVDSLDSIAWAFHLVGDLSRSTWQTCNETAALALNSLTVGEFFVFMQDCRNPPQVLVDKIQTQVFEKLGMAEQPQRQVTRKEDTNFLLQKLDMWEESSSEDGGSGGDSASGPHDLSQKWRSMPLRSSRKGLVPKRSCPIFCNPKSSLIAVVLQALAHREHYVWVTEEDDCLMGIVTLRDILRVMLSHINVFS